MVYNTTTLTNRGSDEGPKPTLGIPSSRAHLAEHAQQSAAAEPKLAGYGPEPAVSSGRSCLKYPLVDVRSKVKAVTAHIPRRKARERPYRFTASSAGIDPARLEANVTDVIANGVALLDSEARLAVRTKNLSPSLIPNASEPTARLRHIASQLREEANLLEQGDLKEALVLVRHIEGSYTMMRKCRENSPLRRIPSHPFQMDLDAVD